MISNRGLFRTPDANALRHRVFVRGALSATLAFLGCSSPAPAHSVAQFVSRITPTPRYQLLSMRWNPTPQTGPVPQHSPQVRYTHRTFMVRRQPSFDAPFRGRIDQYSRFRVLEVLDATESCQGQWVRLESDAYACLRHTDPTDEPPRSVTALRDDTVVPRFYARPPRVDGEITPVPRYRNHSALRRNAPPIEVIEDRRMLAFVERKTRHHRHAVLIDEDHRAIREADVVPFEPSDFRGVDTRFVEIPPGWQLAWSAKWPQAELIRINTQPRSRPEQLTTGIPYHQQFLVRDQPKRFRPQHRQPAASYYQTVDGTWVRGEHIRRWTAAPRPTDLQPDEGWIDIDLAEQTLAIMRGDTTEYVTLISSGSGKHPTPTGLYRIESKHGLTDMRSLPSTDQTAQYYVEDVPWVQYFSGRYALHAAYWHRRFGVRTSHGCVNLAPRDAKYVFEATNMHLPLGWTSIYETKDDPGTVVRVRRGQSQVRDRRHPPIDRT